MKYIIEIRDDQTLTKIIKSRSNSSFTKDQNEHEPVTSHCLAGPQKPFFDRILSVWMPFRPQHLIKAPLFLPQPIFLWHSTAVCPDICHFLPTIGQYRTLSLHTYSIKINMEIGLYPCVYCPHNWHFFFLQCGLTNSASIIAHSFTDFVNQRLPDLWLNLCILF